MGSLLGDGDFGEVFAGSFLMLVAAVVVVIKFTGTRLTRGRFQK